MIEVYIIATLFSFAISYVITEMHYEDTCSQSVETHPRELMQSLVYFERT